MKRIALALFALTLGCVVGAHAQWPEENHYKVYNVGPPMEHFGAVQLADQFGGYFVDRLMLEKFANPVSKNGEPILFPELHHSWWAVDLVGEGWQIDLLNQFGPQSWQVGDPRFLVLPARKLESGPPLPFNHYLAYDAFGPPLQLPVQLVDQFGAVDVMVLEPLYFLNPVEKVHEGMLFPIVDPQAHLACYRIDPPLPFDIPIFLEDQFGLHDVVVLDHDCLCVPSWKNIVIGTENRTWSDIKGLYRD